MTKNLSLLQQLSRVYENGLYASGKEATRLIKSRSQQGVSADGQVLFTKSAHPMGAYGPRHGTARSKRGLQIARVDLTYTGAMFADFGISLLRPSFVNVGFTRDFQAQKMEELETYYGTDILTVSDEEEAAAVEVLENNVLDFLDKLFV